MGLLRKKGYKAAQACRGRKMILANSKIWMYKTLVQVIVSSVPWASKRDYVYVTGLRALRTTTPGYFRVK